MLCALPDAFLRRVAAADCDVAALPPLGSYGVGMFFLPTDGTRRAAAKAGFETVARELGLPVLGWRRVPTNNSDLGASAQRTEPIIEQAFVDGSAAVVGEDDDSLERRLYVLRKLAQHAVREALDVEVGEEPDDYYACSLSSRTCVYKGQLTPAQASSPKL